MNQKPTLFLLDAMALIYRAFFALNKNPRINSKGLNTSAILGFTNTIWDVIRNEKPSHLGVAFDTQAPSLRHYEYIDYKANRQSMPEELAASLPYIREVLTAMKIPILQLDGYEADDILGTFAIQASNQGFHTFIMTSDKDLGQMVTNDIQIYRPGKFGNPAEKLGITEVCEKFGIKRPDQIKDMLGLWGDASDNIPGIPGIGEVTARKLLDEFDTIENLLQNTSRIANAKLRAKIEENGHMAIASKQLATIITDVPLEFNADELRLITPNMDRLKAIFDELEFKTLADRIFKDLRKPSTNEQTNLFAEQVNLFEMPNSSSDSLKNISNTEHIYHIIDTDEKCLALANLLKKQPMFCFDTETTSLNEIEADLVGISFSIKKGEAYYIPIPSSREEAMKRLEYFKDILEDTSIEKTGQNIKYDMHVMLNYGVQVKGPLFDTMIAHYLIEPDQRHNMDALARTWLNYEPVSIETLIGKKGSHQGNMRHVALEKIAEYAAEDADITLQLRACFEPELERIGARQLFEEIEMPLVPVLMDMERAGVRLDIESLAEYSLQLEQETNEIETRIYELAGERFNIASPKQLGVILFEKLEVAEKPKTTKTGQYATGEEILEKLKHKHPIVDLILDFRSLTKLRSTYIDALPLLVSPLDGRLHTSYNQAVASTGRLSSNNPNLQNIPVRTERGREIRKAFVARDDDYLLLAADYSQIELRIMAHLSHDEALIEAFNHNLDIHTATASKVYGVKLEEVTKDQRRNAKMVNFGIIYGISAFGLSERLGISRREASDIIESYFKQYKGVKNYMDKTIDQARTLGYAETICGRRRYLRDITSANATVRGFAERNAINAPIQGSSADMIKLAMIKIHKQISELNLKSKMILQVHDELVFDVFKPELRLLQDLVKTAMAEAMPLSVPVVVDANSGKNWLEAH